MNMRERIKAGMTCHNKISLTNKKLAILSIIFCFAITHIVLAINMLSTASGNYISSNFGPIRVQ